MSTWSRLTSLFRPAQAHLSEDLCEALAELKNASDEALRAAVLSQQATVRLHHALEQHERKEANTARERLRRGLP